MKDLWRLVVIATLSFVIVGVTIAYTRDDTILTRLASVLNSVNLSSIEEKSSTHAAPEPQQTEIWIPLPHPQQWTGLAGFPDTTELAFPLPSGLNFNAGLLVLELDAQLSAHGDARLSIYVDGVRKGEVVLDPGMTRHRVEIDLEAGDVLGEVLVVALDGRGTTGRGQICPVDKSNWGAAISVTKESGVSLFTTDPVDTAPVKLATLADPTLSLGTSSAQQATAIWAQQELARKGAPMRFAPSGQPGDIAFVQGAGAPLSFDVHSRIVATGQRGIDALVGQGSSGAKSAAPENWPVTVDQLGAQTLLKNFRGSRRWTIPYALADLPGGLMPLHFNLALKTSTLAAGNEWVVRVSLNGNLLKTQRFDGQHDTLALDVALPAPVQGLSNAILVELIDTSPNDSICRAGPDAQAQLLKSSTLSPRGIQPADGWPRLVRALAAEESLGMLVVSPLDAAQARTASAALSRVLPQNSLVDFGDDAHDAPMRIEVTTVASLRTALRIAGQLSGARLDWWLVVPGQDNTPVLAFLADPASVALLEGLGERAVVFLIGNQPWSSRL